MVVGLAIQRSDPERKIGGEVQDTRLGPAPGPGPTQHTCHKTKGDHGKGKHWNLTKQLCITRKLF